MIALSINILTTLVLSRSGEGAFNIDCESVPNSDVKFNGCFVTKNGANYVAMGNRSVTYTGLEVTIVVKTNHCELAINSIFRLVEGTYECGVLLTTPKNETARASFRRFNISFHSENRSKSSPIPPVVWNTSNFEIHQKLSSLQTYITETVGETAFINIGCVTLMILMILLGSAFLLALLRVSSQRTPPRIPASKHPTYRGEELSYGLEDNESTEEHKSEHFITSSQETIKASLPSEFHRKHTSSLPLQCLCQGEDEVCPFLGSLV